jgi:hypothetical protein
MATTTPNFGWPVPTSTDLVKDGATAIEALGDGIDTSMVDLKGGTTGQILAKATNADMDFAWITNDVGDITAITASSPLTGGGTSGDVTVGILDATTSNKGAVQLSTSTTSTSTSLAATASAVKAAYDPAFTNNFYAGKNKVINGDFGIWQRGTSATVPIANNSFSGPDRFQFSRNGSSSVATVSRQAFTPGTAPVAGYEGNFFLRFNQTTAGSSGSYNQIITRMEDVTTYAGQTVTFSFWAKADSSRTLGTPVLNQNFGSGGSGQVGTNITLNSNAVTTAWARYTGTVSVPSIAGKTIGTSSYLEIDFPMFLNTTFTFDTWGWMLESGSTATPFQTATGTIQGELAACQRYYYRIATGNGQPISLCEGEAANVALTTILIPITMRTAPTIDQISGTNYYYVRTAAANNNFNSFTLESSSTTAATFYSTGTIASGAGGRFVTNNASAYFGLSAEL